MVQFMKIGDSRKRGRNLSALLCAQVFVSFAGLSIPPLIPFFQPGLKFTYTQVGSLMTFLFFGAMIMSLPAGWLTDKLGVKKMIFLAQVLIGVFAFLFGLLMNHYFVAIFLAFSMGLGYGMVNPPTTKGIMFLVEKNNRGLAMSLKQTGVPIGGGLAAGLLPPLAIFLSWRFSFILAGISVITMGLFSYILYDQDRENFLTLHSDGEDISQEKLEKVHQTKNLVFLSIGGAFCSFAQIALVTYIMLYLKDSKKFDLVLAAFCLTLINVGGILGRMFWGVLSDRFFKGSRKFVLRIIAFLIFLIALILGLNINLPWIALLFVLFIFGLSGMGWNGVYHAYIGELSRKESVGRTTGLCMTIVFVGNICGPILFGRIIDITGSYNMAWLSLCAAMVGAFSLFSLIQEKEISVNY
jgi:sugar phosphate permease